MSTAYSAFIEPFKKRVEKDLHFFFYFNLTDEEAMALANARSKTLMDEAVGEFDSKCKLAIDVYDKNDIAECFNVDFTNKEIFIVVSLMYERYLNRDISTLKTREVNFTPSELRVFDPSNARKTFTEMYRMVCEENTKYIDEYKNVNRTTNDYLGIDYDAYFVE